MISMQPHYVESVSNSVDWIKVSSTVQQSMSASIQINPQFHNVHALKSLWSESSLHNVYSSRLSLSLSLPIRSSKCGCPWRLSRSVSHAGKGLTSWLSFVVSNCEFVTFPIGILGQVWYLIVSIPDLCTLTYFDVCIICLIVVKATQGIAQKWH